VIEHVGHIRNPLTVIAIFAGLAEVSGTIVLPFIEKSLQADFLWFLMLFPALLVVAFFATLNFNRKALYAPSDFREEKNFLALATASPEALESKLRVEMDEVKRMEEVAVKHWQKQVANSPILPPIPVPRSGMFTPPSLSDDESRRAKVTLSEALALQIISREFKRPISQGVRLTGRSGHSIIFDGMIEEGDELHGIEVKYFLTRPDPSYTKQYFKQVQQLHDDLLELQRKTLSLIYVVVTDSEITQVKLLNSLRATAGRFSMSISIRVFGSSDLVESVEKSLRPQQPPIRGTS
jgi:hypothetical protein